jgi:peptidoglycan/LPS O-acetylase OafA/YrhL
MPARLPVIDALKGIASQLIVLHHLAFYGPMSDVVSPFLGGLVGWLTANGRIAVQVFLVLGGFMAARALAPQGRATFGSPLPVMIRRYLRLSIPYAIAIGVAIVAAAIARHWADFDSTPAKPSLYQIFANLLMLQNIVGQDSLSAGLWYVAIDLQLYCGLTALLWLASRQPGHWMAPMLVAVGMTASLFYFNRDAAFDIWGIYFFGSYGLGALTWWATTSKRPVRMATLITMIVALALILDFRTRIAVALAVAALLFASSQIRPLQRSEASQTGIERFIAWLGKISYSVFLVHYPICLLVNAGVTRFFEGSDLASGLGLILALIASTLAGAAFHRYVELRFSVGALRSRASKDTALHRLKA